ncbi:MAG: hypothetical protein SGJ04_08065 [Bacteroidota bacterium]|nr:hypothetical protein [Bacteroidota bacterium]
MIKKLALAVIKLFPRNKAVYDILKTLDLPKSITDKLPVNGKYSVKIGVNQVKFLSSGATHDNRLYWRGLDSREGFTNKI